MGPKAHWYFVTYLENYSKVHHTLVVPPFSIISPDSPLLWHQSSSRPLLQSHQTLAILSGIQKVVTGSIRLAAMALHHVTESTEY